MHEIRIDDDVMKRLEDAALRKRRPFATHNEILRILLGFDQSPVQVVLPGSPTSDDSPSDKETVSAITYSHDTIRTHQRIGPRLLREHGLPAKKGYFSKTGRPYSNPDAFPAVFFDPDGYLVVRDETSMRNSPYINAGARVSVRGDGISSVPGYVACGHTHE